MRRRKPGPVAGCLCSDAYDRHGKITSLIHVARMKVFFKIVLGVAGIYVLGAGLLDAWLVGTGNIPNTSSDVRMLFLFIAFVCFLAAANVENMTRWLRDNKKGKEDAHELQSEMNEMQRLERELKVYGISKDFLEDPAYFYSSPNTVKDKIRAMENMLVHQKKMRGENQSHK